jgi:hypothetical protein
MNPQEIIKLHDEGIAARKYVLPLEWLNAAEELNRVLYDLEDHAADTEVEMYKYLQEIIVEQGTRGEKKNVAAAEIQLRGTEIYRKHLKEKALVKRVEELIRLGKLQARLREFGS